MRLFFYASTTLSERDLSNAANKRNAVAYHTQLRPRRATDKTLYRGSKLRLYLSWLIEPDTPCVTPRFYPLRHNESLVAITMLGNGQSYLR